MTNWKKYTMYDKGLQSLVYKEFLNISKEKSNSVEKWVKPVLHKRKMPTKHEKITNLSNCLKKYSEIPFSPQGYQRYK